MATYMTVQGDTWDLMAYKLYGDEKYMRELILSNWALLDMAVFPDGVAVNVPRLAPETTEDMPIWRTDADEDDGIPEAD